MLLLNLVSCRREDSTSVVNWVTFSAHDGGKLTENVWRCIETFLGLSGKPSQGFPAIHLNHPSCPVPFVTLCFYIIHDNHICVISFDNQKLTIRDFLILTICTVLFIFL